MLLDAGADMETKDKVNNFHVPVLRYNITLTLTFDYRMD
jgi:hypothetical protein